MFLYKKYFPILFSREVTDRSEESPYLDLIRIRSYNNNIR